MSKSPFAEEKNFPSSPMGSTTNALSSTATGAIAASGLFLEFYVPVCLKPTAYLAARATAEKKKVKLAKQQQPSSNTTSKVVNFNDTTPAQRYLASLLLNADVPKSRSGVAVLGEDLLCYRYNLADREQRNFVLSKLVDICTVLGPKLCRTYVVPSLEKLLDIDDATAPISKSLSQLFELCDGYKTAGTFTNLIHTLCGSADPNVSMEAARSIKLILQEETERVDGLVSKASLEAPHAKLLASCGSQLERKAHLEKLRRELLREKSSVSRNIVPLLQEMSDSLWSAHRCSAACLLPAIAKLLGTEDWIATSTTAYISLCEDPDVTVRRAAVTSLHEWLHVVSSSEWVDFPLSLVAYFASETKQDSVGINLAAELVPLAQGIGKALTSRLLLAPTIALARDVSWRVRFTIATNIGPLIHAFSNSISALLPSILLLTRDEEVHVRAIAASQLGALTDVVDQNVIEGPVVDVIYELAKDPSPEVRAAVAKAVSMIAVVCPPAVRVSLLTCVLASLINDAKSTLVQHAAINSMTGLKVFKEESGSQEVVSLLVAQLEEASKSSKWRVRQAVASQLNAFSEGTSWDFDELMPIFLRLLNDDVAAVRNSALDGFPVVAQRLGSAWLKPKLTAILPQMVYPERNPKHYRRIQACQLINALLPTLDADLLPAYKQRALQKQQQSSESGGSGPFDTTTVEATIDLGSSAIVSQSVKKNRNSNDQMLDVLEKVLGHLSGDAVPSVQDHFRDLLSALNDKKVEVLRAERDQCQQTLEGSGSSTSKADSLILDQTTERGIES